MCCCGLNTITALNVPTLDNGVGALVDTSGLQANKTIEISGTYPGAYDVLGSHDGTLLFPMATFNSGAGAQSIRTTVDEWTRFMTVRRRSATSSPVTALVAARAAGVCATAPQGANNFLTLATLRRGAAVGARAALDLWSLIPSTGLDSFNIACGGRFRGVIAVEGSTDGTNFSFLGTTKSGVIAGGFNTSQIPNIGVNPLPADILGTPAFPTLANDQVVRYVRVNVLPGTVVDGDVVVTMGGPQNCDCTSAPVVIQDGTTIEVLNDYATPLTFSSSAGATTILDQFWYDFDRLTTTTINVYISVEGKTDGNGTGKFGVFILPDGDPVLGNLFGVLQPVATATVANSTSFHGYDGNITIPRPSGLKQVLFAAQPIKSGGPDVTVSWRSVLTHPANVA